ncbi:MAG TPA: cysteine peptidase family C39 domain-containing protein [Niabella sp.]|nr:cysteine peptidase family C39 domain-containing protein [Niabella sp.]HQX21674.1 cysteine peptidase family C39 domain-containing protein [Niabella sp.]HRB27429.1 cysteine peptidase family C39 domain-containing protein [Niabella sp.]HRB34494.1 cysteine peptidase family C39 domain-containing protein [Niabella sp.]HRB44336.1 cysteine peptidase family C39 domain-containing protein [Niabella sp.]
MRKETRIKQRDITDCGAACLASVAAYPKLKLPVSRIRQYAGTDKRGTNVLGLIEAAEKLGFQAKGAKGSFDSLFKIPLPAIVHVVLKNELQHYLVLYKVTKKHLILMDPADGRILKKTYKEFQEIWTGVIVLLIPEADFVKGNQKTSNIKRFWQLIRPHSSLMFQALVGAVVYTVLGLSTSIYMQKIIDFVLVEGNVNLSGGQRQRLAIVRALYRDPEILILDEATSSLDPASEQKVQATLHWFQKQGKTIIIIAHRLSTIKNCDQILVLQNGSLVESGSHDNLLLLNNVYSNMWVYHARGNN